MAIHRNPAVICGRVGTGGLGSFSVKVGHLGHLGAIDGGPQCPLSILRNGNVPYRYSRNFPVALKIGQCCLKPIFHCNAKTICVGSWHWLRPPTPQFRVGDTNMLVSKNAKICSTPNAKYKICVTPNAKPQREPMEYRLR